MKRLICLILSMLMALSLTGCGSEGGKSTNSSKSVDDVLQEQMDKSDNGGSEDSASAKEVSSGSGSGFGSYGSVDVDLTALSSTVVYSEVYNMMVTPEDYEGKTVKMSGQFAIYQATDSDGNPVDGQIYFACVIADATACCQQGLEFVLAGDFDYPDDYPALGTEISVVGEFHTYYEGEVMYCHLTDAELIA